jgi:putative sensory transduction regulator
MVNVGDEEDEQMDVVQRFDRSMIERFLVSTKLRYLRDNDGDFVVQFGFDTDRGNEMTFMLMTGGSQGQIYAIYGESSNVIQAQDVDRAIRMCNMWNTEKRWPKAYVRMRQDAGRSYGRIMLEGQLDLEKGIHQELFDDYTSTIFATASSFWEWAHKEQGF